MLFRPSRPRFQVVSFMTENCHVWFWGCFSGHLKQCLLVRYCNYWINYCKRYLNFLQDCADLVHGQSVHLQLLEVDKRSEFFRQGTCHRVVSQVSTTTNQPTNELQSQQAIYNFWSPKSMHIYVPLIFKWTALNICNHSSVEFGKARKWWESELAFSSQELKVLDAWNSWWKLAY